MLTYLSKFPHVDVGHLEEIAHLMMDVRQTAVDDYHARGKALGDDGWSLATGCFARTRNQIRRLSERSDCAWLTIVDASLQFVFEVDGLTIRFHQEKADEPRRRLGRGCQPRHAYHEQMEMVFDDAARSPVRREKLLVRMVVVTDDGFAPVQVDLVQYHPTSEAEVARWPVLVELKTNVTPLRQPDSVELPPLDLASWQVDAESLSEH